MNPLTRLARTARNNRDLWLARHRGGRALQAYFDGDYPGFRRQVDAIGHRGGNHAVYLTVVSWLLTAKHLADLSAPDGDDDHFYLEVGIDGQRVDNPDALTHPVVAANVWATRMYVAVLNDDQCAARALFHSVSNGDDRAHFGRCLVAAASVAVRAANDAAG